MWGQAGGLARGRVVRGKRGRVLGAGRHSGQSPAWAGSLSLLWLGQPGSFIPGLGIPCVAPSKPWPKSLPETQHPLPSIMQTGKTVEATADLGHPADPGRGRFTNLAASQGTLLATFWGCAQCVDFVGGGRLPRPEQSLAGSSWGTGELFGRRTDLRDCRSGFQPNQH